MNISSSLPPMTLGMKTSSLTYTHGNSPLISLKMISLAFFTNSPIYTHRNSPPISLRMIDGAFSTNPLVTFLLVMFYTNGEWTLSYTNVSSMMRSSKFSMIAMSAPTEPSLRNDHHQKNC